MNKKYCYDDNWVNVDIGTTKVQRACVDNIESILITENSIEILENKLKAFEQTLYFKNIDKKTSNKLLLLWTATVCLLTLTLGGFISLGTGALMFVFGMGASFSLNIILKNLNSIRKKDFEELECKISVNKYELENEKNKLIKSQHNSRKVNAPKDKVEKKLPFKYQISNLKRKLMIIEIFRKNPKIYVKAYDNDKLVDLLDELGILENIELIKFLIDEYKKQQIEKENVKCKNKSKNKR